MHGSHVSIAEQFFQDRRRKMLEPLQRLAPLAAQVVGLIEDRRDPPLLVERGNVDAEFLEVA
jgi:hypothetical protein